MILFLITTHAVTTNCIFILNQNNTTSSSKWKIEISGGF